jgi:prophage antirepressor-like protein
MSFIINIFENLLKYNDKNIFIVLDINNNIWFKMSDILRILGYNNIKKAGQTLNKKYKYKFKYIPLHKMRYPSRGTSTFNNNTYFINESGLYQLLSNSKKELAGKFRDELFSNILPSIRKTGQYKISEHDNNKLKNLNNKLKDKMKKIVEENNYYEDKHNYKPTKNSYIYIVKKNIGNKKCYKIGYTDNIKQRIKLYKTTSSSFKIIYYIDIIFDGLHLEQCIKNINKLHKLKEKTDDLCYLSLKQLKNSIKDCIQNLKNHICNCIYCKKKFKINYLDKHLCK